jgi:hypothetical protein
MVPSATFQVTDLSVVVPWTVAVNGIVPLVSEEAVAGETVTEVTTGAGGGGAVVTVTVVEADLVVSATLVAVTVSVPGVAGAV